MARHGGGWCVHGPVQRAERRATAVGSVRDHAHDRVRRCHGGAARSYALAVQLRTISERRRRPTIADSRSTSSSIRVRGGLPASLNQPTRRLSPSTSHVPVTTPPATTIGAIQPLCLLTAVRRFEERTCASSVPGPSTYWSNPGKRRTAVVGFADAISSRSADRT